MTDNPERRPTKLGKWLQEQLDRRDLTIRQAALYIGISNSQLWGYVHGVQEPKRRSIRRMADYFGVPPFELESMLPSPSPAANQQHGLAQKGHTFQELAKAAYSPVADFGIEGEDTDEPVVASRFLFDLFGLLDSWAEMPQNERENIAGLAQFHHARMRERERGGRGANSDGDGDGTP